MFAEEEGPAEAATGLTDAFVDAGIAKLDGCFGDGYARTNPQALAAYVAGCASNLNAFMTAATALPGASALDEALVALEDDFPPEPAPKPRRRRR